MKKLIAKLKILIIGTVLLSIIYPANIGIAVSANKRSSSQSRLSSSIAEYKRTLKKLNRYTKKVIISKPKYQRAKRYQKYFKTLIHKYSSAYKKHPKKAKQYRSKLNRHNSRIKAMLNLSPVAKYKRTLKKLNRYTKKVIKSKPKYQRAKRYQKTFKTLIHKYSVALKRRSRKTKYYQSKLNHYDATIKAIINPKIIGVAVDTSPRTTIPELEEKTGYNFGSQQRFQSITQDFDRKLADWLYSRNMTMEIAWMPRDPSIASIEQPAYRLSTIIRGDHDDAIRRWARQLKEFEHPIYFRPMPEMNDKKTWAGNANGNSPSQFIPAWRHIHDIFQQEEATNVKFVWCPNRDSSYKKARETFMTYYPGDKYVDYNGFDGYNFGTIYPDSNWRDADEILKYSYETFTELSSKPIIISEIASTEQGGNKAAWTKDFLSKMKYSYPKIKIVYWFNINKQTDFRIESSQANLNAFRVYSK